MDLGNPMEGGWLDRVPATASLEEVIEKVNTIVDRLNDLLKTQIFTDGTSRRMLMGFQAAGFDDGASDFGIKISIPGVDVMTATPEQLLFSMSMTKWDWRNVDGELVKQFVNATGTDSWYESGRNYANIGQRESVGTRGLEVAKPGQALENEPQ